MRYALKLSHDLQRDLFVRLSSIFMSEVAVEKKVVSIFLIFPR